MANRLSASAVLVLTVWICVAPSDAYAAWTRKDASIPGPHDWTRIVSSSDGTKLAAYDFSTTGQGYVYTSIDSGATWTRRDGAGLRTWNDVAISGDGAQIIAITGSLSTTGYVYTSSDGGANWTEQVGAGLKAWNRVVSSTDGSKLAALVLTGSNLSAIYTSTDSGANWTERTNAGTKRWSSLAQSANGTKLAAAEFHLQGGSLVGGNIFTSTDSGSTWATSTTAGDRAWGIIRASADGTHLAAASTTNGTANIHIFTSDDWGSTWTQQSAYSPTFSWKDLQWSSDGSILYSLFTGGATSSRYVASVSTDGGVNWTVCGNPSKGPGTESHAYWVSMAVSGDGSKVAVAANTGGIQTSTDSCANWTENYVTNGIFNWVSVAASSDGSILLAADAAPSYNSGSGNLYKSSDSGATWAPLITAGHHVWTKVVMSSDGTRMYALDNGSNKIFYSTDSGATWAVRASAPSFSSSSDFAPLLAVSADGLKLAGTDEWEVFTSTDGGANWTTRSLSGVNPNYNAASWITSSSDGSRLTVLAEECPSSCIYRLYTSTNSGANWTRDPGVVWFWPGVSSSADGLSFAIASSTYSKSGYIVTSTDGGATFTEQTGSQFGKWCAITSSTDGSKLVAAASNCYDDSAADYLFSSSNSGVTWSQETTAGQRTWRAIASAGTGNVVVAVEGGNSTTIGDTYNNQLWIGTYSYATPPTVSSAAASSITTTGATLNGTIDSVGSDAPTTRGFVYGATIAYGATTTESNGGGFSTGAFTANASSLTCNTTYHFNAYVTNTTVTVYGSDTTFTTSACASGGGGSGGGSGGAWTGMTFGPTTPFVPTFVPVFVPASTSSVYVAPVSDPVRAASAASPAQRPSSGGSGQSIAVVVPTEPAPLVPQEPKSIFETEPKTAEQSTRASRVAAFVADARAMAKPLIIAIQENETVAKITAFSIGALALISRPPLAKSNFLWRLRSLADLPLAQLFSLNGLMWFFGLRKRRRYWGTVYDSVTKQPLDPAFVELVEHATGKVVEESFTDMEGRFGFLDRPGTYTIRAQKTHYRFPSQVVTGTNDAVFENVYHGEIFEVRAESSVIAPNIPMDQIAFDWNQQEKKRLGFGIFTFKFDALVIKGLQIFFWAGFVAVIVVLVANPTLQNAFFALVYALLIVLNKFLPSPRLWGQITSIRRDVKGLVVQLRHPTLPEIIVGRATTDVRGRFFLKVAPGAYGLEILSSTRDLVIHRRTITVRKNMIVNDTIGV